MLRKILHMIGWTLVVLIVFLLILWAMSQKTYPVDYGLSFSPTYATSLGLDWQRAYTDMLTDLQPKYLRIAAQWNETEPTQGHYDFSNLDWMMQQAAKHNVKIILVVGQKAPRWPEYHVPSWAEAGGIDFKTELSGYIKTVVQRYQDHAALEMWQVENEPYLRVVFGDVERYRQDLVAGEIALVRTLDPKHEILITDSGELSVWHKAIHAGDWFGTTVYRIVRTPQGWTFSYGWLPPAYYRYRGLWQGKPIDKLMVSELQAEPWFTHGTPLNTSIAEQEKTMDPVRLEQHLEYVQHIGFPRVYVWGVEWWYWMKEKQNDARYWDLMKEKMHTAR